VISILRQHGFLLAGSAGSHQKWRNDSSAKQVIVPYHRGRILPLGTMKAIIEGSGIDRAHWVKQPATKLYTVRSRSVSLRCHPSFWYDFSCEGRLVRELSSPPKPFDNRIPPLSKASCQPPNRFQTAS
jgi:predicted RNA binding protein YcfA (HicA-like mRNA interferase family)